MNPFIFGLVFLVGLMTSLTLWFFLPSYNLHLSNSRVLNLKTEISNVLDQNRSKTNLALEKIGSLKLNGITIHKVEAQDANDFVQYRITYSFTGLFTNQFLTKEKLESKTGVMEFVIDKV